MLLIEGPNAQLRATMIAELTRSTGEGKLTHLTLPEHEHRPLKYFVKLLHTDHGNLVCERLGIIKLATAAERNMIGMGLLAKGTIALVCHSSTSPTGKLLESYACTADGLIPKIECTEKDDPGLIVEKVLDYWQYNYHRSAPAIEMGSIGGISRHHTMIITDLSRWGEFNGYAFLGGQGSNLFVHQAIAKIREDPNHKHGFYMTDIQKTTNARTNMALLNKEMELVKPQKIVAMGTTAVEILTKLKVPFVRTEHPRYWARFNAKGLDDLVNTLK